MKVIAFINKGSGAAYHRIVTPLLSMGDPDVYITNVIQLETFEQKECHMFMYNRILPDASFAQILELKRKYGFKICVDVDDWWHLNPEHILYQEYIDTRFAERQVEQLLAADLVFVTHDRLYKKCVEDGVDPAKVFVVPNCIPKADQFLVKKEPHTLMRIFYQGSVTHEKDLELLRAPIYNLGGIANHVKMILGGFQEEDAWYRMAQNYTAMFKHQYAVIPGMDIAKYYQMYAHADLCLVPLLNNEFNRHKSNLKVLEAGNLALPCIVSNVHPYLDMPVTYTNRGQDWIKEIKAYLHSKRKRREDGERLKEFCDEQYNFVKWNGLRQQVMEDYCN
jgi:glycosyltransferase involved in cell wall biosynthesis